MFEISEKSQKLVQVMKAVQMIAFMVLSAATAYADWRAEKSTVPAPQGYAAEDSAFYTGKPYLASTGGYAFKYRNYNPELARWTSEDPSGFPDGANGNIYAPTPTSGVDFAGLYAIERIGNSLRSNSSSGNVNVLGIERSINATASIHTLGEEIAEIHNIQGSGSGSLAGAFSNSNASVSAFFQVTANENREIVFTPQGGNWNSPNGDLQVASTWGVTVANGIYTFSYTVQSKYNASGVTGAGIKDAELTWTGGQGLQDVFTTMSFRLVE